MTRTTFERLLAKIVAAIVKRFIDLILIRKDRKGKKPNHLPCDGAYSVIQVVSLNFCKIARE